MQQSSNNDKEKEETVSARHYNQGGPSWHCSHPSQQAPCPVFAQHLQSLWHCVTVIAISTLPFLLP